MLWPLEPATEAKHRLYRAYLDAWWPIMLQPAGASGWLRPRVTYVDAFAGPGRYQGGEPGSPVFVLERLLNHVARQRMALSRDRVCLVFMEKDKRRYKFLLEELYRKFGPLEKLPVRVEVRNADASCDTEPILTEVNAWKGAVLAVFDSWGNVNVPLTTVKRIGRQASSEVITTFGPNWFSRRQDIDLEMLDAVFGGRDRWTRADAEARPDKRWREWLATYQHSLLHAGFSFRLQFQIVTKTGIPLYLIFGTKSVRGVEVMKDGMWNVDVSDGMSFKDPRTRGAVLVGQLDLFRALNDGVDPELLELIEQRLKGGEASVEELREWLTVETARWRRRDAIPALKIMRDNGQLKVEPSGRILKLSRVTLSSA